MYKRGDSHNPKFDKQWFVLNDGVLKQFKTQEDALDGDKVLGFLKVADMLVNHDSGPVTGPDGPLECFALTPSPDANQGHIRRILCGVASRGDREMWTSALDSTQINRTLSGRSVHPEDTSRLPPKEKW